MAARSTTAHRVSRLCGSGFYSGPEEAAGLYNVQIFFFISFYFAISASVYQASQPPPHRAALLSRSHTRKKRDLILNKKGAKAGREAESISIVYMEIRLGQRRRRRRVRSPGTGRRICHPPKGASTSPLFSRAAWNTPSGVAMVTLNTVLGSRSGLVNIDMVCESSAAFAVFVCESMKKTSSGDGKKLCKKFANFLYFFSSRAWLFGFVFFPSSSSSSYQRDSKVVVALRNLFFLCASRSLLGTEGLRLPHTFHG